MKALSGVYVGICWIFLVVNWKNLWIVQSTCFGQEIRFPHWKRWCEWNTQFKTDVRRFIRGEHGQLSSFATRLCGRYVWPFVDLLTQTHLTWLMNLWNWVSLNCIRSDNLWLFCCSVTIGFILLGSGVLGWHIRFFFSFSYNAVVENSSLYVGLWWQWRHVCRWARNPILFQSCHSTLWLHTYGPCELQVFHLVLPQRHQWSIGKETLNPTQWDNINLRKVLLIWF